jgi:hypothetical protein
VNPIKVRSVPSGLKPDSRKGVYGGAEASPLPFKAIRIGVKVWTEERVSTPMSQRRDMGHPEWWWSQWKGLDEGRGEFGWCLFGGGSFGCASLRMTAVWVDWRWAGAVALRANTHSSQCAMNGAPGKVFTSGLGGPGLDSGFGVCSGAVSSGHRPMRFDLYRAALSG